MMYTLGAQFKGDPVKLKKLRAMLNDALWNKDVSQTIYQAFKVEILAVDLRDEVLDVTFACPGDHKQFVEWACKACGDKASYTATDKDGNSDEGGAKVTEEGAVKKMDITGGKVAESASASNGNSTDDQEEKESLAFDRGRFQIIKAVASHCSNAEELCKMTGIEYEEFERLYNLFGKKGS